MHVQNGKNRFESTRLEYEREKCNYIIIIIIDTTGIWNTSGCLYRIKDKI